MMETTIFDVPTIISPCPFMKTYRLSKTVQESVAFKSCEQGFLAFAKEWSRLSPEQAFELLEAAGETLNAGFSLEMEPSVLDFWVRHYRVLHDQVMAVFLAETAIESKISLVFGGAA